MTNPKSLVVTGLVAIFAGGLMVAAWLAMAYPPRLDHLEHGLDFVPLPSGYGRTLQVARTEVTIAQWDRCVSGGACPSIKTKGYARPSHPMTGVSWLDVQHYLHWLAEVTGEDTRLPSRQEWLELAAEHRPVDKPKLFDDSRLAWAADYDLTARPKSKRTQAAGAFGDNTRGISDLQGNVWEWTATCPKSGSSSSEDCRGTRIAMGEHEALLSELVRDPGNASCGGGLPPSNLGFRVVYLN